MGVQLARLHCFYSADLVARFDAASLPLVVRTRQHAVLGNTFEVWAPGAFDAGDPGTAYEYFDVVRLPTGVNYNIPYIDAQVLPCALPDVPDMSAVFWLIGVALVAVAAREFVRKAGVF